MATAGILSRVIGLLYNSPMTAIIGDEGNGYYEFAYRAYTIILLVSSYSIPSAISKVIASYLATGEYKNAQRIFRGAFLYVLIIGAIAGTAVFFFADMLVQIEGSATVLKFFAPTILFSGMLGVFRGYFQAHRTMTQTSISQILEQGVNALASILLALWLTGLVPVEETTKRSVYGASGGAIGTGIGVLSGLLLMCAIYALNLKMVKKRIAADSHPEELSYRVIFKMILLVVTPFILSTCIYNVNTYLNQSVFIHSMHLRGLADAQVATLNSAIGKATKISTIPIAISSAMSAALIPGIAGDFKIGRLDLCRDSVAKAIRGTMFVAIPAALGIMALSEPLLLFLYPQPETLDLSTRLLMVLAPGVVLYSLSTLSGAVLQGTGRLNAPVINAAIALALQTFFLVAMLELGGIEPEFAPFVMVMAVVLFALLMCILNGVSVRRHLAYHQEWERAFVRPLLISLLMGAVAFGAYHGLYVLIGINIVSLCLAVIIGVLVYFIFAIRWQVLGAGELKWLPRSEKLIGLVEKIGKRS